jgi:multicomponent Na+:H+ antiporter subunit D
LIRAVDLSLARAMAAGASAWTSTLRQVEERARRLHGPRGLFARTWPSGAMGLGVMLMLLAFLLSYYLA